MKTRTTIHWLAGFAGGLLLALPALIWTAPPSEPPRAGGVPTCEHELYACEDALQACLEQPGTTFPGDGQTGAPLAYAEPDPPDGTFTDLNTGLMWEMKLAADDPRCLDEDQVERNVHCVQNVYTWTADAEEPFPFNGTAFTEFLAELKGELGDEPFAGYEDWRLPTAKELQSLVDYSVLSPGPTVAEGLPGATAAWYYWSSTSNAYDDAYAWGVAFSNGYVGYNGKGLDGHVRAVRGGR